MLRRVVMILLLAMLSASPTAALAETPPLGYPDALRPLAEEGNADAQFNLGFMYYTGKGVEQDYDKAVKWYRRAAEQGYADAQFNLGWMYHLGKGVKQDYAEAVKWYRRAAEQEHAKAQSILGFMYGTGKGLVLNYVLAHKWYNLAAAQGEEAARKNRDLIVKTMTASQITEAQKLARQWKPKSR